MSNRTKLGLNILEAALLLGVLGNALLRQTPWGLNVFLWTGALVAAMWALHARSGTRASWRADGGWLLAPIGFFAAAFAWRDSATLKWLDGLALFVAFALLAWRARGRAIRLGGLADYALGLVHAALDALFGSLPLIMSDVKWATMPRDGVMRHAWAAARGLVIAVPLLFIFGALLMAADAVFEGIMRQTFQLDTGVLFSHFFLMLMFAWMTGGFLRGMMLAEETTGAAAASAPAASAPAAYTSITADDRERPGAAATGAGDSNEHRQPPESVVSEGGARADGGSGVEGEKAHGGIGEKPEGVGTARVEAGGATLPTGDASLPAGSATLEVSAPTAAAREFSLGAVEVGVVLGSLNVLFACFVIVQFRYFFGGAERVMSITELTYSEYARRGFFELTWVAGLVLPLLLGAHALLRKNSAAAGRIFRTLAGAQVGLLFVIMASAVARMRLYQSEYGLTELRLYTTAFMLWLGLVFVWFAWTVLVQNARRRFACGALVAAFVTAALLHFINPDAYIVRANAAHARAGRSFDAAYAASLSADAVPALVSALPALGRDERCYAARALSRCWSGRAPGEDWRAWSLARSRAWRAVAAHPESLSEATCPPPVNSMPIITSTTAPAPQTTATTSAGTTATNNAAPITDAATINAATTTANVATTTANATTTTTNATTTANANAASLPMNGAIKSADAAGASNAARGASRDRGKTKQRRRARDAGATKTR
ncbi:MAG TPA: DUF4173 domain-containing protein [Pyrinomonadaceae bacterium]|jgi:hypothetical protein